MCKCVCAVVWLCACVCGREGQERIHLPISVTLQTTTDAVRESLNAVCDILRVQNTPHHRKCGDEPRMRTLRELQFIRSNHAGGGSWLWHYDVQPNGDPK